MAFSTGKRMEMCMVFSTPLYGEMRYIDSTYQFHTFSANGSSYGLSFADVSDAQNFYNYVIGFLTPRLPISSSAGPSAKSGGVKVAKFGQILTKGKTLFKRKNDKESNGAIIVNDFEHIRHVGFSENNEFKIRAENEELANELIEALRLKINNKGEMQDVMNVIDRFGADRVRKALDPRKRRPAPLPPTSLPPPPPAPPLPTSVPNTQPGRGDLLNSIIHFDTSTLTKVFTNIIIIIHGSAKSFFKNGKSSK
ncbi:unnamed protein product [Hymenolepis diminuta]|uniref:WH1 domain-containing protein n=1 Tax=Hymenolepis diminuta TaxID=6216 RepID=A0A564YH23_HYMDI|nr:unnamed protein product [Hymenolepis diminuta]